ncbi:MAG: hypothetical protein AAF333_16890 [Planctomycetota bacterium]
MRNVRGGSVGLIGVVFGAIGRLGGGVYGLLRAAPGGLGRLFSRGHDKTYESADVSGGGGSAVSGVIETVVRPVELRVSRGVLVLLAVMGLAVLGLVFQAGQHVAERGTQTAGGGSDEAVVAQADTAPSGENTGDLEDAPDAGPELDPGAVPLEPREALGGAVDVTVKPAPVAIPRYDPRAPGRAYLILATVRPSQIDGIRKLQRFMAESRVATYLDTTNNGRFHVLVDVSRGFTAEEQRNGLTIDHKRQLMLLGQKWKQFNNNRGHDLSDMYWDLYHGPSDGN